MKKIFLLATSALLLLTGCAKETFTDPSEEGGLQNVTFTAGIPSEIGTKAVFDKDGNAANVNRCIMEIYYGDELFSRQYAKVTGKQASFTTQLVANRTYKVAFWADCVADASTDDGLATDRFYTTNATGGLQAVAIKGDYAGNSDARDAFALCKEYTVAQQGGTYTAVLRRPFAQINVITTDVATVAKVAALKPDQVSLTLNNAVTTYNVIDSTAVSGATDDLTYTANVYNWNADTTACTLSMDYIFAENSKQLIDIDWAALKSGNSDVQHSFASIPYQRNYRTNIKGALLTTTGQWNVTVDPIWEEDTNGKFDVAYTTVCDIAGANDFVANNTTKKEISVTFSSQPSDAGVPTQTGKNAIVTSLLAENATYNIDVASSNEVLYVGDYDYDTSGSTTTYDYETILPGTSEKTNSASVNLVVTNTQYIGTLVVNSPSKSVSINGQTLASGKTYHIENLTVEEVSMNTVIIESGMTVTNLVMKKGGLEIHGSVTNVSIPEGHGTILVRDCENLSQDVYDVLKGYIATGYASEQGRTTSGLWDIYPAPYKIGETYYGTLAAAVAAVPDNQETTITVVANDAITDRNVGAEITANKIVILDLNGKTISHVIPNEADGATIRNKGTLTVKDGVGNGKITTTGTPDSDWLYGLYAIDNWKDITVKSGTIEFNGNGVRGLSFALSSGSYGSSTTTVIDGGTVTSTDYCAFRVYYQNSGSHKVTINDGTIVGAASPVWYQICTDNPDIDMTINGGYVTYNDNASKPNACPIYIWAYNSGYDASKAKVSIKGGYFKGGSSTTALIDWNETDSAFKNVDKAVVSGGYFSALGTEEVAAGFQRVANSSSEYPWTVEAAPVCKIGDEYYYSLAEAVADVPENGEQTTIVMIGDNDLGDFGTTGVEIAETKNIILDLNGKTIKGNTKTTSNSQLIYNKGILTIVDNSNDQDGCIAGAAATSWKYNDDYDYSQSYASNTINNSGTINVNSGIIYNGCASPNGSAAYAIDNAYNSNGVINITGGKLETAKAAAVRMFYNAGGAELNVSGNAILKSGGFAAFQVMGGDCKVNISAGTFQGSYGFTTWGIGDNAVITITGGVFEENSYVYRLNSEQITDGMVNISGGYFKGLASYNGRINLTGGYFKSNCYDDCELSSITESGYSVKANTDEQTKDDYPWTVAKAPTPEGGVFQAADDAELSDVIAEINTNSAYWGSAYTIQLGAGTYGSDITIKQYPEWNGIKGNSGDGNNTSDATKANKTVITLKGADNFATKWEGAINVVGCGYSQSGDLKFGTDVVSTTIDGIYFDETTTLNKPTYVVTGTAASSNVIVKNCKFKNCKYCTMLGDANSYSFNSHVEDCEITDCEVVCSGRVQGDIGFVMKNLVVTGLSKGFFNVQASVNSSINNCNVTFTSTAEYGIRNSDAATVYVKDCTFTSLPESKPFTFIRKDGTVFTLENVDCSESSKILKFSSAYANSKVVLKGTTSPAEFTNEGGSDNNVEDQRQK